MTGPRKGRCRGPTRAPARRSAAETARILVVGPAWVGDMVMAQCLLTNLRQRLPGARLDVLAPASTAALTARMPEVDRPLVAGFGHGELALGLRRGLAATIARCGYAQAIVLQRSAKAALIPWLARIPRRTGYRGEMRRALINDIRRLDARRYPRKQQAYAWLGLAPGDRKLGPLAPPRLTIDRTNRRRAMAALGLDGPRPAVGLAPGAAYGAAKRWRATHYARLAAELARRGIAAWIFGTAADRDAAACIRAAAPHHAFDLCGRTSLLDVIDLAAQTRCFVGNDTGILHVAAASGAAVAAIYGPTHPDHTPPMAPGARRFWLGKACAPCRARACPLGHRLCMGDIGVADVLRACLDPAATDMPTLYGAR